MGKDYSKILDQVPRIRTTMICLIFPFILITAFFWSLCVAITIAFRVFGQHFKASYMPTYNLWKDGISVSVKFHDKEYLEEFRNRNKDNPWVHHT